MGYVYFIKPLHRHGPIKIGKAKNVEARLSGLQTSHYEPLEVFAAFESNEPLADEARWHARYRSDHVRGEWFAASGKLYWDILSREGIHTPLGRLRKTPSGWRWSLRDFEGPPVHP